MAVQSETGLAGLPSVRSLVRRVGLLVAASGECGTFGDAVITHHQLDLAVPRVYLHASLLSHCTAGTNTPTDRQPQPLPAST